MARRLVTVGSICARLDFPFLGYKGGELVGPFVELGEDVGLGRHVLGLIVAVLLSLAELNIAPELIRNFYATITALPDERRVSVAIILERFLFGIKILLVLENPRAALIVQLVATTVSISEETRGAPFQMIQAQLLPQLRVFELICEARVLVLNQLLARVAAVHADQAVEH